METDVGSQLLQQRAGLVIAVNRPHPRTRVRPISLPDAQDDAVAAAPRLAASWERSESYGISLDTVEPVFTGSMDTGSLLNECGSQVLRGLQTTLANEPISLMVADSEGLVLTRLCNDAAILRSLDKVHLAPGFFFAERNAGTNGLGLALADRAPSLVRADEHYCTALRGYTCAAAPILDPIHGDLAGTINLTTWSDSSSELLLALAQSAAGNTTALMAMRATGRAVRPAPRGEVFHVWAHRTGGDDPCRSAAWRAARDEAESAVRAGQVIAVVGEPGVGKKTLLTRAHHAMARRERVITARVPAPDEVDAWLSLWTPELANPDTCVIVSGVAGLPAWAVTELAEVFGRTRQSGEAQPFAFTAPDYDSIPDQLAALVDRVVEVPPLRRRGMDVMPLARHFAERERRRPVSFTSAAEHALTNFDWPGNARQLHEVVQAAAVRADIVDARHLDPSVFSAGGHSLTRLETFERDEIVRCLTAPGATMADAVTELGMSRATIYRKIAHYNIKLPPR